jgi:hypothetical protein
MVPVVSTVDLGAVAIAVAAAVALLRYEVSMLYVLGGSVVAGAILMALH